MTMEEAVDSGGVTKSSLKMGQQVHNSYMADVENKITKFKEYTLPSGKRIDFLDFSNNTIYELKPNNSRSIANGLKQLNTYKSELESMTSKTWNTILHLY